MKKQKGEQKPLPILPNEITEEILARLPVKSLLRFRCVSKSWYNLVSDPRFIKLQLDRAIVSSPQKIILECDRKLLSVEFEAFDRTSAKILDVPLDYPVECIRLGGSCNGLICFSEKNSLYVWNPFTRIYKELPNAPFSSWDHFLYFKMGIGYSPRTDEYKVIKFVNYERSSYASEVFVHTLGMQSWRSIARFPSGICLFTCGAFLNGALHWVAAHGTGPQTKLISVLDLEEEKFTDMQLPDFGNGIIPSNITVLGEHLSIYCHFEFMDCFEIWVMKEYGNEKSWTKQFSDRQMKLDENNGYLQLLGFRRSGEILLQKDYSKISLYNLVNKRIRDLQIQGRPLVFGAYTSVESLVPPKVGYDVQGQ